MWKSILWWFKEPVRNFSTSLYIDKFIYKLIDIIKSEKAEIKISNNGAIIIHILLEDGRKFNIWGDNQFYGWCSRCGTGKYLFNNSWEDEMPSRRCSYDFWQVMKPYYAEFYKNEKKKQIKERERVLENIEKQFN